MDITDYIVAQEKAQEAAYEFRAALQELIRIRAALGGDDEVSDWTDYESIHNSAMNV